MGAGVERGELVVADLAGDDHAAVELARPRAGGADQHERQLARRVRERGDAAVRIGVAEVADPQQVVLGHAVALARGGDLGRRPRAEGVGGRLGDHLDALGVDPHQLGRVLGDRARRADQPRRALDREPPHAAAQAGPQRLPAGFWSRGRGR